jgi:hypothetical protein
MINLKPTPMNITVFALLAIAIIIGAPLALIWSLNTLFPILAIPYTLETWLAAFIIPAAFKATVATNKKD